MVAIELDDRLPPVLAETLAGLDNVEVIFRDFNKLDLKEFEKEIASANIVTDTVSPKLLPNYTKQKSI